jgi:hypothetical protein
MIVCSAMVYGGIPGGRHAMLGWDDRWMTTPFGEITRLVAGMVTWIGDDCRSLSRFISAAVS